MTEFHPLISWQVENTNLITPKKFPLRPITPVGRKEISRSYFH